MISDFCQWVKESEPLPRNRLKGNAKRKCVEECGVIEVKDRSCFKKERTFSFVTCYGEFKSKIVCWVGKEEFIHTNDSNQKNLLDMNIPFVKSQM